MRIRTISVSCCTALLVAGCASDHADPVDQPDEPIDEPGDEPGDEPVDEPGDGAVATRLASELYGHWKTNRPGDAGVVEYAELRFHGDVIPEAMADLAWTPQIRIGLYVHKTNFQTSSADRVEIIEPQAATLVARTADSATVKLADGTTVSFSPTGFRLGDVAAERAYAISSLTHWPELTGEVGGTAYSLSRVGSYVATSLPAAAFDTLDVPGVTTPYGVEKRLVVGDAEVTCVRPEDAAATRCSFQVRTTAMSAVDAAAVTYEAAVTGVGIAELVEALGAPTRVIETDDGSATMTCDATACTFVWTRARPDQLF